MSSVKQLFQQIVRYNIQSSFFLVSKPDCKGHTLDLLQENQQYMSIKIEVHTLPTVRLDPTTSLLTDKAILSRYLTTCHNLALMPLKFNRLPSIYGSQNQRTTTTKELAALLFYIQILYKIISTYYKGDEWNNKTNPNVNVFFRIAPMKMTNTTASCANSLGIA